VEQLLICKPLTDVNQAQKEADMGYAKADNKRKNKSSSIKIAQAGSTIKYDEIRKHATHVTGIAHFSDPEGRGNFRIYVSGQPDKVDRFAEEAVIVSMHIAPAQAEDIAFSQAQLEADCKNRFEELQNLVDGRASEKSTLPRPEHDHLAPNLQRDRLIQVEVLDKLEPKITYAVSIVLDPISVAQHTCDIYGLWNDAGDVSWVSAAVIPVSGDPDLFLYRGGIPITQSRGGPGWTDSVSSGAGAGIWSIHVNGYEPSNSYDLAESWLWRLDADDIPDTH
jgi:hypothetical protein